MWYSKEVVGETYIKQFMPKLTAALNTVHVTNGQIRRGAIEKMARNGISDRNIAKASGHKSLKTLDNYNVGLTIDEQFKMATIVGTSGINTKVVAKKPANSTDFEFSYDTEMSEEDMLAIADETPDEALGSPAKKKFKKTKMRSVANRFLTTVCWTTKDTRTTGWGLSTTKPTSPWPP